MVRNPTPPGKHLGPVLARSCPMMGRDQRAKCSPAGQASDSGPLRHWRSPLQVHPRRLTRRSTRASLAPNEQRTEASNGCPQSIRSASLAVAFPMGNTPPAVGYLERRACIPSRFQARAIVLFGRMALFGCRFDGKSHGFAGGRFQKSRLLPANPGEDLP